MNRTYLTFCFAIGLSVINLKATAQKKTIDQRVDSVLKLIGEESIVDFARRFILENGVEIFNFGKYKGKAVADVLRNEPQYYDWMMKGDFPQYTKQKLTEIRTRSLLKKN